MRRNVASQVIGAQMVSATDGSAFTGSVTCSVTINGGTQATGTVGSGACTHEGNGYHTYAPSQAETNGQLVAFTFTGSGAIPVTVQVFTTGYDYGSANLPANVTQFGGSNGTFASGRPEVNTTHAAGTAWGSGAITAAALASDAITAAKVASDVGTEIATAVWASGTRTLSALDEDNTTLDLDATIRTAVGMSSANLDTQLSTIDGNVDSILADTGTDGVVVATNNDKTGYAIGTGGISASAYAAGAVDAAALAADAGTEIASAVLTAAESTPIEANVKEINDTALTGDGSNTPWGPA